MSDQSRLVAGLLTLIPLAAGSSSAQTATSQTALKDSFGLDSAGIENFENNQLDLILKPAPIVSRAENLTPEFSIAVSSLTQLNPDLYLPAVPQPTIIPQTQPHFDLNSYQLQIKPQSGAQLYQQRQAALRAGKLFTRLDSSSFQSQWLNASVQPSHQQWQTLLAQEAKVMSQSQGRNHLNIMVGDSLTLWFPTQALTKDKFWLNQGISGEQTSHILHRIDAFAKTRPDRIYLMAGINDLRNGKSDYEILSNLRQIVKKLRQNHPQTEVIVQSILPTRLLNISHNRINQLNYHLQNIAQQQGAHYLDLSNLFTDTTGQLNPEYTTDGLHLSLQGYNAWHNALQQTELWLNQIQS